MKNRQPFDHILRQFIRLEKAAIDSSSVIYAVKAGFFQLLSDTILLISIPDVLRELKIENLKIEIVPSPLPQGDADKKLLALAIEGNLPLISEDKKLLRAAHKSGLDYFNSLMMLNFLLFRQIISDQEYQKYLHNLRSIARYGDEVWEIGEKLHAIIQ